MQKIEEVYKRLRIILQNEKCVATTEQFRR